MKIKLIYTTTDSNKIADKIAEMLVHNNQSPCVQIIPNIQSTFKWKDKLEKSSEILLVIKTMPGKVQLCKNIILQHHNYEVPELVVIEGEILSDEYRNWFIENSR